MHICVCTAPHLYDHHHIVSQMMVIITMCHGPIIVLAVCLHWNFFVIDMIIYRNVIKVWNSQVITLLYHPEHIDVSCTL